MRFNKLATIPYQPPQFPAGPWATLGDVPDYACVIEGGVVKRKLRVFHNDGADFIDCGRPALLDQLHPTVDEFAVRFSFKTTSTNQMYLFGLGPAGVSSERQLGVRVNNVVGDQQLSISIGGDYKNSGAIANLLDGTVKNCVLKVTTTNIYLFVNNAFIFSTTFTGSSTSTNNLMIGTLDSTSPSSFNFQGDMCCLEFYSGVGDTASASVNGLTLLDSYNFTDSSLWDGSTLQSYAKYTAYQNAFKSSNRSLDSATHFWSLKTDSLDSVGSVDAVENAISYSASADTFIGSQFDANSNRIYTTATRPAIENACNMLTASNSVLSFPTVENEIDPFTKSFTITQWMRLTTATSGYIWGRVGLTAGRRFGIFLQDGVYKFTHGGVVKIGQAVTVGSWMQVVSSWNHTTKQLKFYVDGVLLDTFTSDPSPYTLNNAPFTVGARWGADDSATGPTYSLNGSVRSVAIYNRVLSDDEVFGLSYNPNHYTTVVCIGSSSLYGQGPTDIDTAYARRLCAEGYANGIQVLNVALGGTTIYEGSPTGYTKPSYVTGERPAPVETRNVNYAVEKLLADYVVSGFASNYVNYDYTEGPNVYSEYVACVEAIKTYADENGVPYYAITPQPVSDTAKNAILSQTAEYMYKSLNYSVYFYPLCSNENNALTASFDSGDGVHQNEAGHEVMFRKALSVIPATLEGNSGYSQIGNYFNATDGTPTDADGRALLPVYQ